MRPLRPLALLALLTAVLLTGCTPGATLERAGDTVTLLVDVAEPLGGTIATLLVPEAATTADVRCDQRAPDVIQCRLGNLTPDTPTTVTLHAPQGAGLVRCTLQGTGPNGPLDVRTYRCTAPNSQHLPTPERSTHPALATLPRSSTAARRRGRAASRRYRPRQTEIEAFVLEPDAIQQDTVYGQLGRYQVLEERVPPWVAQHALPVQSMPFPCIAFLNPAGYREIARTGDALVPTPDGMRRIDAQEFTALYEPA